MLSKTGEIRRDEACLDYAGSDVILYPCHGSKGNQYWEYEDAVSWQFVTLGQATRILGGRSCQLSISVSQRSFSHLNLNSKNEKPINQYLMFNKLVLLC